MKEGVEIGVDEAGRGPLFGRVYTAAVILDDTFDHSRVKDSKKFTSKKKIKEVSDYIKSSAVAWSITYADEKVIDEINNSVNNDFFIFLFFNNCIFFDIRV